MEPRKPLVYRLAAGGHWLPYLVDCPHCYTASQSRWAHGGPHTVAVASSIADGVDKARWHVHHEHGWI